MQPLFYLSPSAPFRALEKKKSSTTLWLTPGLLSQLTSQGKTVTNACKLLFKLSRDEHNDAHFRTERVGTLILDIIRAGDVEHALEGLVYACGTLKNLSSTDGMLGASFVGSSANPC